jgi:hypothetical protein
VPLVSVCTTPTPRAARLSRGATSDSLAAWLGEVEDQREGFVEGALLGCGESAGETVDAFDVDGPELLDEDAASSRRRTRSLGGMS